MNTCILINTTIKYLPLVEVQLTSIKRYAASLLKYQIFVACDSNSQFHLYNFPIDVVKIPLLPDESGFIESRIAALEYIQDGDPSIENVLLLQDDFWIDRPVVESEWNAALAYLKKPEVKSVRLMPCPGPAGAINEWEPFARITDQDQYKFTFQAGLWKINCLVEFFKEVLASAKAEFSMYKLPEKDWSKFCIRHNVAENVGGQDIFKRVCMSQGQIHLAIPRRGNHSGAVNLATVPYRPTAVVQGSLEKWAKEFAIREGFLTLEGWY